MTPNISRPARAIRTIRSTESDFTISDGIIVSPRASIEISSDCPTADLLTIQRAFARGWLKPVAHVRESEYFWDKLTD